ncbi:MAG: prepilin-type N-terminal cleavage/methylation domain-containing protein [Planctomycetia bacterium]|nr:prepilin-type N-terminal cleavage/methylation domain-containing protein [Planctomycetia bacterium]
MKKGFTLIELLIVIGLLAALAAILLPSLMGDREEALSGIDSYNAAGTLRTLRQFETLTSGRLPNGMHAGLQEYDGSDPMNGISATFRENMHVDTLTEEEIEALNSVGITKLAYGSGDPNGGSQDEIIGYHTLDTNTNVVKITDHWGHDHGGSEHGDHNHGELSFNGKTIEVLYNEGYSTTIPMFIAPTTDWTAPSTTQWTKGFSVGMDIPGKCPISDSDFPYYIAFVGIKTGSATYSVTTPEHGTAPMPEYHEAGTLAAMEEHIIDAFDGENDWTAGSFTNNAEGTQGTMTATYDDGTNTAAVTYTVTYDSSPTAKLLGTSCPECGVINP